MTTPTRATWLRPFNPPARSIDAETDSGERNTCPKCASTDIVVEYHELVINGFTCYDLANTIKMTEDLTEQQIEEVFSAEHLCKACLACQYCWCEKTADAQ